MIVSSTATVLKWERFWKSFRGFCHQIMQFIHPGQFFNHAHQRSAWQGQAELRMINIKTIFTDARGAGKGETELRLCGVTAST